MSDKKHLLVAFPSSVTRDQSVGAAFDALRDVVTSSDTSTTVHEFPLPSFKIGSLDALVQQADDLAKLDTSVEGAVRKAADVIAQLVPGQEAQYKLIDNRPADGYITDFRWNRAKYNTDRPIASLLSVLSQEASSLDTDIKSSHSTYQNLKASLIALHRKTRGNLSTCSLAPLISKNDLVESEYLETLLIAVPKNLEKDWLKSYETLAPMVVPRSSSKLTEDKEYLLYNVTVFKKHSHDFVSAARSAKFIPRDFSWSENAAEEDEQEAANIEAKERQGFKECLNMAKVGYQQLVQIWVHVKALRVFVESVLRYGLPADFASAVVVCKGDKGVDRARGKMDERFGYLGGIAVGRDSKGRVVKDEAHAHPAGVHMEEYSPYCCFAFEAV